MMDYKVRLYLDNQSFESTIKVLSPFFMHPLSLFQTLTEFYCDQLQPPSPLQSPSPHSHHTSPQSPHQHNNPHHHAHLKIKCLFDVSDTKASSVNAVVSVQKLNSYEEEVIHLSYTHELFGSKEGSPFPQSLQSYQLTGKTMKEYGPFKISNIIFTNRRATNLFGTTVYFEKFTSNTQEYHRIQFFDPTGDVTSKISSQLTLNSIPFITSVQSKRDFIVQTITGSSNPRSNCCQLDDEYKCPFDINSGLDRSENASVSWDEPLGLLDMEDLGNYFDVSSFTETKKIESDHFAEEVNTQQNAKVGAKQPRRQKSEAPEEDAAMLQKKRNCEASARYRRKKQKEEEETKRQLSDSKAENKKLMKRLAQLEQTVQSLTTDKRVLEAKLEALQAAGVGVFLQKIV